MSEFANSNVRASKSALILHRALARVADALGLPDLHARHYIAARKAETSFARWSEVA